VRNPLVTFLVVGTMKGGTTALGSFLAQHPEICFAPAKEGHCFDKRLAVHFRKDIEELETLLGWDLAAWKE